MFINLILGHWVCFQAEGKKYIICFVLEIIVSLGFFGDGTGLCCLVRRSFCARL